MVYNLTTPISATRLQNVPYLDGRGKSPASDDATVASSFVGLSVREIRAKRRNAVRRLKKTNKELSALDSEYTHLGDTILAYEDLLLWVRGFLTFERPTSDAVPSLCESIEDGAIHNLYGFQTALSVDEYQKEVFDEAATFVIEHNWLNAISRADEFASGSFRLPYDTCIFEFMVTRKRVVAICTNYGDAGLENEIVMQIAVESLAGWALSPNIYKHVGGGWDIFNSNASTTSDAVFLRLVKLVGDQIRAACIALDAEVATSTLVRESHAGQDKDHRDLPEYEYYTISLAHRQRAEALASSGETKGVKRLHFRRGHWRHYATFKTWVRWALVGNPELGFIDKQYRL